MQKEIIIKTKNLTKKFGNFTAVNSISFETYKGEIFGFLGANGAGKTTTIKMLCGILTPTEGEGYVAGFDIYSEKTKIKQNIGYMSQKFSLYEDLRVEENLLFYGGIYNMKNKNLKVKLNEMLVRLDLLHLRKKMTSELPLGWKQKLALGCALLHNPEIIFLDEPTAGVDPISRKNFWYLIYNMVNNGKTIFVTTHYLDEAEYCHRISIMHQGKIIVTGTPEKLKSQYKKTNIEDVFISLINNQTYES
ncbi:ABC transporter ATP-binding protein [candidate division KSB1 bacterium]|nr:MAG: ABC transporter ATP-binding protein [candidate division KSB1 bacterium]